MQNLGLSILPFYALKKELEVNRIVEIAHCSKSSIKFGVRWTKGRDDLTKFVAPLENWLKEQEL